MAELLSGVFLLGLACGVFYMVFWLYMYLTKGICTSKADMTGKTIIITGANAGIGFYTAMDLAARNGRVILGCRDVVKGQAAMDAIQAETGNNNVVLHSLDVSSLASVRAFTKLILQTENRLDVLINNAGVMGIPSKKTSEGLEYTYATNHFGPFLLTNLLLGLLKKSAPSRIVTVSSIAHKGGEVDFSNLCGEKPIHFQYLYYNSKLFNVMFTRQLAEKLKDSGVRANCLEPGSAGTNLFNNMVLPLRLILNAFARLFFRTPEEGAQTSIYCAVAEEVQGISGEYFAECKVSKASKSAQDSGTAKKLWEFSERVTGMTTA